MLAGLLADDVTLLATTPSGLQNQLNCLRNCCVKMGMEINKDKTKVMVFRKGGRLGKHEKWYYNGNLVNVVNSYMYLGFTFTTKLSYKEGTDVFVAKVKKAIFHLCKALMRLKNMKRQTFLRLTTYNYGLSARCSRLEKQDNYACLAKLVFSATKRRVS